MLDNIHTFIVVSPNRIPNTRNHDLDTVYQILWPGLKNKPIKKHIFNTAIEIFRLKLWIKFQYIIFTSIKKLLIQNANNAVVCMI